jgi:hypothetical protein
MLTSFSALEERNLNQNLDFPNPSNLLTIQAHNLDSLALQLPLDLVPNCWINSPRTLTNNIRLKSLLRSIGSGTLHTIIKRQPHTINIRDPLLPQDSSQTTITNPRLLKGVIEGRVHLHLLPLSLLHNLINLAQIKLMNQLCAFGTLYTMIRPQSCLIGFVCVGGINNGCEVDEWFLVGMV